MKNDPFKYFVFLMLSLLMVATTGCTEDDISMPAGQLPDETPMNSVGGQLCSGKTFSNKITVSMYEGDGAVTEEICYALTKPVMMAVTVKAIPSPELVAQYNSDDETDMKEFPVANVALGNGGSLTMAAGKREFGTISITLSPDGLKPKTLYLLAVALTQNPVGADAQGNKQVIYYRVNSREKTITCIPETIGQIQGIPPLLPEVITAFYVSTETYQPLIASVWRIMLDDMITRPYPIYSLGNIVNLKRVTISYDGVGQRALFELGSDLAYVSEHRDKYIHHLQEYKRKVCLCTENGGEGIGFCNMNDTQIADFVRQVKGVIERYQLDGVNLWDEDDKYGKAEMPGMSTISYPRLIKALREAPPDKLLTLVNKGDATEYFYDVSRCGGIEVGGYIDCAWHGHFSSTGELQIVNPDLDESVQTYSKYTRRFITGLTETRYGCVNVPRYSSNDPNIRNRAADIICKWKSGGNKKSNILIYGDDLIGNEYGDRENAARIMLGDYSLLQFMDDGDGWGFSGDELIWRDVVYSGVSLDLGVEHAAGNTYRKDWQIFL